MRKTVAFGYGVSLIGTAVWLYGYLVGGSPSLIRWDAITPWWIADYLPNIQAEIGMALMLVSMVPIYWPARPDGAELQAKSGDLAAPSLPRQSETRPATRTLELD